MRKNVRQFHSPHYQFVESLQEIFELPIQDRKTTLVAQFRQAIEVLCRRHAGDANDSIQFVAGHSIADGPGSVPRWVRLSWQPGPENGRLTLNEYRILPPDQRPEAESHWSGELLRARTLEFRFLRTDPAEGFPEWIETWDPVQQQGLPAAVAIISDHAGVDKLIVPLDSTQANRQDARFR